MLRISGVRVAAIDLDDRRLNLAKKLGADITINPEKEDVQSKIENWTNGFSANAVIFTAATKSSEPLSQSFKICKKKGKVILVGVSGMNIERGDIYEKELDFMISTSYGPGRYDKKYEEKGNDYPYAYVRWTENRNMTEYLRLLSTGEIKIDKMIDKIYSINQVEEAFESLKSSDKPLFVLLDYGEFHKDQLNHYLNHKRKISINTKLVKRKVINIALVGAGNFATGTHLPNIQKLKNKYNLYAVVDHSGHKAKTVAERYGAEVATTEIDKILIDEKVDLVLIATRHDSHGHLVLKALKKGKHVFVEKPLSINEKKLNRIEEFYSGETNDKPVLMTGYNRRFSTYAREIKKHTANRINPLFIHYRMNAGYLPKDHWVHENGGRIVGEACHIVDLMTFLTGSVVKSVSYKQLAPQTDKFSPTDNVSMVLRYEDGSTTSIEYFVVGNKKFPKEYMEVHFDEKTLIMDDYKSLKGYGIDVKEITSRTSNKGQLEELEELFTTLNGTKKEWPIDLWDMLQTTNITLNIK
jgi:predicted dehydrogenase